MILPRDKAELFCKEIEVHLYTVQYNNEKFCSDYNDCWFIYFLFIFFPQDTEGIPAWVIGDVVSGELN